MTKKKDSGLIRPPTIPIGGVGTQTKYMIEPYKDRAISIYLSWWSHESTQIIHPQKVEPWGDDFRIFPSQLMVMATHEIIRSVMQKERPDALWFMTDPRFYGWLWEIENEIRSNVPMVYYHVWDNFPAPKFNAHFYNSKRCCGVYFKGYT